MSKALIIKEADFSENALDTVVLEIPCTDISLSVNALTFSNVGETKSFSYTLTPQNTTQPVIVSSSDDTVCTVNGANVTVTGIGTAAITVRCGNVAKTISVTATELTFDLSNILQLHAHRSGVANGLLSVASTAPYCTFGKVYDENDPKQLYNGKTKNIGAIFFPNHASGINVVLASTIYNFGFRFGSSKITIDVGPTYIANVNFIEANGLVKNVEIPENSDCFIIETGDSFSMDNFASMKFT